MKIALFGYGKMGRLIEQIALQKGHQILVCSRSLGKEQQSHLLSEADLAIDFSHHQAVLHHIDLCCHYKKNIVIGTTGWDNHLLDAKKKVVAGQIGCIYSPNFSLGIALFKQIVAYAAKLIGPFEEYDLSGLEYHHRQKVDAPSGTAKALTEQILRELPHLQNIPFTSVRCGSIPGTHTLLFDSPVDTITLTHEARNREGFASGAVKAAEWLVHKKGFFTLNDLLKEQL